MRLTQTYSAKQFGIFRVVLAMYMCIHFLLLVGFAPEMWSNAGMLADEKLNLTYGVFPNLLNTFDTPFQTQVFVIAMAMLSALLAIGIGRRWVALLLWLGWVMLFNRNNFISNPSMPFVGWLLLVMAVVPHGESFALLPKKKADWQMPRILLYGAWIIMALSYTISGIDKLNAPSWCDGSGMRHLLENPLARNSDLRTMLLNAPEVVLQIFSYIVLAIEITFLPLCLFAKGRKWAWTLMVALHLSILVVVDFADLTIGMMMIHVFTYDPSWFRKMRTEKKALYKA
ncbi:MAG: HTTM domain-containing protein [Flavobacteriales bacterium]